MEQAMMDDIRLTGWRIPTEAVRNTYRGRIGCGCGCRGTYSSTKHAITRRTKFLNEMIGEGNYALHDHRKYGSAQVCFAYEDRDDDKCVWVYVDPTYLPDPFRGPRLVQQEASF